MEKVYETVFSSFQTKPTGPLVGNPNQVTNRALIVPDGAAEDQNQAEHSKPRGQRRGPGGRVRASDGPSRPHSSSQSAARLGEDERGGRARLAGADTAECSRRRRQGLRATCCRAASSAGTVQPTASQTRTPAAQGPPVALLHTGALASVEGIQILLDRQESLRTEKNYKNIQTYFFFILAYFTFKKAISNYLTLGKNWKTLRDL